MRPIKSNYKAVSNIIGALMLTLIVVTAATSFAIFVSQKQEQVQDSEYLQLQRDLENIEIINMQNPIYNSPTLKSVEFKISNIHTEESRITTIYVNGEVLDRFKIERHNLANEWWDLDLSDGKYKRAGLYALDSSSEPYIFSDNNENHQYDTEEEILDADPDDNLNDAIPSIGEIGGLYSEDASNEPFYFQDLNDTRMYESNETIVDDDPDNDGANAIPSGGEDGYRQKITEKSNIKLESREYLTIYIENISKDLLTNIGIFTNDAVTLKIQTVLNNNFEKIFIPPTSIIQVTTEAQWDPSIPGFTGFLILDGSLSDHPSDGYIKNWTWTIEEQSGGTGDPIYNLWGRKVRAPDHIPDGDTYEIFLTVVDNYGMIGTSSIIYP